MKTLADEVGKELVSEWKSKAKIVDAQRAIVRNRLDDIRDTIRKPLTDWEHEDEQRKQLLRTRLADLGCDYVNSETPLDKISQAIQDVEATDIDETWGDYINEAQIKKDATLKYLRSSYQVAEQREADQAELQKLRAEQEERRKADEERDQAERLVAQDALEAKRKADHAAQIEAARQEAAEKAAQDAKDEAARAAEAARQDAEQREAALQQQIEDEKRRAFEAAEAERTRIEAQRRADAEAQRKLEADADHRSQVTDLIYSALFKITGHESQSDKVATALMANQIPHVELKL